MKKIRFIKKPKSYNPDNSFVVHLSSINSKTELFERLYNKLKFPNYFGFNWDALSDCLRDLHWIKEEGIVLVHDEIPMLDENSFNKYIEILVYSVRDWKKGEKHYFEVVFPVQMEAQIKKDISKINH